MLKAMLKKLIDVDMVVRHNKLKLSEFNIVESGFIDYTRDMEECKFTFESNNKQVKFTLKSLDLHVSLTYEFNSDNFVLCFSYFSGELKVKYKRITCDNIQTLLERIPESVKDIKFGMYNLSNNNFVSPVLLFNDYLEKLYNR